MGTHGTSRDLLGATMCDHPHHNCVPLSWHRRLHPMGSWPGSELGLSPHSQQLHSPRGDGVPHKSQGGTGEQPAITQSTAVLRVHGPPAQGSVGQGSRAAALQSCASPTQCLLRAAALPSIALLQAQRCCWGCWVQPSLGPALPPPPTPFPWMLGTAALPELTEKSMSSSPALHTRSRTVWLRSPKPSVLPRPLTQGTTPSPAPWRGGCHSSLPPPGPAQPSPAPQLAPEPHPNHSVSLPAGC